ncbi:MAG: type IV pili methyl-accepting chemotaxis transducer N-terminal domain-containing protein [Paracoccaceae bacterium]
MSMQISAPQAVAEDFFAVGNTVDDRRRANFVSRQKMLVERMAAKSCFLINDFDASDHGPKLDEAHELFVATQAVLRDGNTALGLEAETNTRVLERLSDVEKLFAPFDEAALAVRDGARDPALLKDKIGGTSGLLAALERLGGLIDRIYVRDHFSLPTISKLDYAGLQLWLSQKLVKEACMLATTEQKGLYRIELQDSVTLFEARLAALRDGEILIGLPPATDPELVRSLDRVAELWGGMRTPLMAAIARGDMTAEELRQIVEFSTPLMTAANDAVFVIEGEI